MSRFAALRRIPATWLVIAGICSVQLGAALGKGLFGVTSPDVIVWLRLATSATLLLLIARPGLSRRTGRDWLLVLAFGACLGTMNWAIYQSFARIPLGLAVTIEFLGPLAVALIGSRRLRDVIWVVLAAIGVVLLGFGPVRLDPIGVGYAALAGACWAGYILLGARLGRGWSGLSGLTVASAFAALGMTVLVTVRGELTELQLWVVGIGIAIGILSSVIPYSLEITALRTMPPKVFGILMSLEPAAAAVFALALLGEVLGVIEWVAIACVVAASIGATRFSGRSKSI